MRGIVQLLEIDDVDLMPTHGTDVGIPVAAGVDGIVRLFNRKDLHDFPQRNIHDGHAVAITNRNSNVMTVGCYRAMIWFTGKLNRAENFVCLSVRNDQGVIYLAGGEKGLAIRSECHAVDILTGWNFLNHFLRSQINNRNSIALAVANVQQFITWRGENRPVQG